MSGLWRFGPEASEGKFLVLRRDGSKPTWPNFVLGARDPAAPTALMAYARVARELGMDQQYVADVEAMAQEFEMYRQEHGAGDPDAPPHRLDDPATVARMRAG